MSPVKSPEKPSAQDVGKKDKIVVEKDESEELPPGWTKEVKTRKTGSRTKVDRLYTDPVTGCIFRSLKDVQRYLNTGEVGRLAIKPKIDEKQKPTETSSHKRAQTDKSESPARASKRLAAGNSDARPPSPAELKTRQATRQAGIKVDSPSPPEPKTRHAACQAGVKIDSPPPLTPDSKTRQATPLTGLETDPSPPSQPEPKARQAKRLSAINASPQSKTRRATRQAGIKIDTPPPSPPDTRTSRQATRTRLVKSTTPKENHKKTEAEKPTNNRKKNADVDANTNRNQETSIITPPLNQESNKNHIETNLAKQESPVVNPTITNPVPQSDSSINFSMTDLWTDPCIEFAVKTLTGAIPFTDLNKVENFTTAPSHAPLEDIWTDPCIEFAIKTLTGAIPVKEEDYLLHKPASSANFPGPHSFSSPTNVYQTGHNNNNKQQDVVFPGLGNGGLQKSGNFVNGINGQGSRSRFFQ